MFLAGLGLPSQLEREDEGTLLGAQMRWQKMKEDGVLSNWQERIRATFG